MRWRWNGARVRAYRRRDVEVPRERLDDAGKMQFQGIRHSPCHVGCTTFVYCQDE